MTKQPQLSARTAADGVRAVLIELTNRPGLYAVMDPNDFRDWLVAGRSISFFAYGNGQGRQYVGFPDASRPGNYSSVGRTLLDPGRRKTARHRDGNWLNLRRGNLYAGTGKGSGRPAGQPQGRRNDRAAAHV